MKILHCLLLELFEQLKDNWETSGHPVCPSCGVCNEDHEPECVFAKLLVIAMRINNDKMQEQQPMSGSTNFEGEWNESQPHCPQLDGGTAGSYFLEI